ncbi:MAG: hypothetical protein KIT14_22625 [bacterium]|nr:hypothetical protein [bacterium]
MILHSIRFRGIAAPWRQLEASLDFDRLGDGLHCLVGRNGKGKTTFLELTGPASTFLKFPSYDEAFIDHIAPGVRDAFSELVFEVDGVVYRTRVQADPQFDGGKGKTEAYLWRLDDETWTPIAGPLVNDFRAAIKAILPDERVFMASVFACQGGDGSLLRKKKADAKDTFMAMLGTSTQPLAVLTGKTSDAMLPELERVRTKKADAERRRDRATALLGEVSTIETTLVARDAALGEARREHEGAVAALGLARDTLARVDAKARARVDERQRFARTRDEATARATALDGRLTTLRATLAEEEAILSAAAALPDVETRLAAERAVDDVAPVAEEIARLDARRTQLLTDHQRVKGELEKARAAAAAAAGVDAAERDLAAKQAELARLKTAIDEHDARTATLEAAADAELDTKTKRLRLAERRADFAPRRTLLDRIPGVPECAACPLTAEARAASDTLQAIEAELATLPPAVDGTPAGDALRAHRTTLSDLTGQRSRLQEAIATASADLARRQAQRDTAATVEPLTAALATIVADGAAVRDSLTAQRAKRVALEEQARTAREALEATQAELARVAARLPEATSARAVLAETEAAATAARIDAERAATELAEHPVIATTAEQAAATTAEQREREEAAALRHAETARQETTQQLARLSGEREGLGDIAGDLAAAVEREAALTTDIADLTLLERALGRDGVQALEIANAGPAVQAHANNLLMVAGWGRFQLSIETTVPTKDRKKMKEVFEIRILDAEADRAGGRGSGGEMVLIEEALRLGIAIYNAERSGYAMRTLWRDETAGALSPENADAYIAMLRHAMRLGQFTRCLFIAHQPEVWRQADSRIFIEGGQLSLEDGTAPVALPASQEVAA